MKKARNGARRLLCLCLCLLLTSAGLMACDGKTNDPADTAPPMDTAETDEPDVLDGVRFDQETLNVMSWIPSNVVEYVKEDSAQSDNISHAVFLRNASAMEQLNIGINWSERAGNFENMDSFITAARNAHFSGGGVDIFCCYSCVAASLATEGFLADIGTHQYMDFSKPFYSTNLLEDMTVNGHLYFCTGDISTNLAFMSSMVFFNKGLVADYDIEDRISKLYGYDTLYDLVLQNKWTMDVMFTLCEDVYLEMGDPESRSDDLYGFGTYNTLLDNFYYSTGNVVIEVKNGLFNLSDYFANSDFMSTLLGKVEDFLYESGDAYYYSGSSGFSAARQAFSNGKNLFSLAPASHAYMAHYKAQGLKYGVLPVPMYDENCSSYSSVHSMPYSIYGVSSNSGEQDIAGAYLQCLGEYSYEGSNSTRVVIFEQTMKGRYSNDVPDAAMWDIILATQKFDMGRVFSTMFGSTIDEQLTLNLFRKALTGGSTDWSSVMATNRNILQKYADRILTNLKKVD